VCERLAQGRYPAVRRRELNLRPVDRESCALTAILTSLWVKLTVINSTNWCEGVVQIGELEENNSKLTEEIQTLKSEIESKEKNEDALQERMSELDNEISTHVVCHLVFSYMLRYLFLMWRWEISQEMSEATNLLEHLCSLHPV